MLTLNKLMKSEKGHWHSESIDTLPETNDLDSILWVDAEDPTEQEVQQLKNYFKTNSLDLKELNLEGRRSKIEEFEDNVSCFVRFPDLEQFVPQAKTNWLFITANKTALLSIHQGRSDITCEIYKKISTHGYAALSLEPSSEILLYIFLDLITNECFSVSDLIHESLQNLSQKAATQFRQRISQSNQSVGLELGKSRTQVLSMRQLIRPLREVVGKIARGEFAIVSAVTLSRFEDLYDRTISLIDVVDSHREEIQDIANILINVQTVTTNNIVRVLTIISAIFLPLSLIAGIYGTNFGNGFFTPGSNNASGFYAMIAVMATIALTLIAVFRRKGWL